MSRFPSVGLGVSVFTTGQVAGLLSVAPRTVSKWCDSGKLDSHRLPGSNDRRVTRQSLLAFLKEHNFPIPSGLARPRTALCVALDPGDAAAVRAVLGPEWDVREARHPFEAGMIASGRTGAVFVGLDTLGRIEAAQIASVYLNNAEKSSAVPFLGLIGPDPVAGYNAHGAARDVALEAIR